MTSIKFSSQSTLRSADNQSQSTSSLTPAKKEESFSSSLTSTTVNISGRAMLLSRLFRTENPNEEPKIETSTTTANSSGSVYNFLTLDDRDTLSKLYEFSKINSIDPVKVDNVAFDLAHYRMAGPAGPQDTTGSLFDLEGNPIINKFNSSDEDIAQKVLTSKAMGDTLLDHGFLKAVFNPGKTPVHASDFSFLEQAVFTLSASGSDGAQDPNATPVVRPKKEDIKPLKLDFQTAQSGNDAMISRLFKTRPIDSTFPLTPLDDYMLTSKFANSLNNTDQEMLGRLYAVAQSRNEDLSKIDYIAILIGNYRVMSEL